MEAAAVDDRQGAEVEHLMRQMGRHWDECSRVLTLAQDLRIRGTSQRMSDKEAVVAHMPA